MKKILFAAVALVLAACSPKPAQTTLVSGLFPEDSEITSLQLVVGDQLDTVVNVSEGKCEVEVPTNVLALSYGMAGNQRIQFVADGFPVTLDFATGKSSSANSKGVQSRLIDFLAWNENFMDDYRANMEAAEEDDRDAIQEKAVADYNAHMKKMILANKDNVLGMMAMSSIDLDDAAEALELIDALSPELQADPRIARIKQSLEASAKTAEGMPFVDFEVLQDPEDPASVVKFSDFVGNGKYVLVDFWASWCGPCRGEMPNLRSVYEQYHGEQFDMLSVAVWDKPEDTVEAAAEEQIAWNQIINAQRIPTELYGIQGIPHIILFGPDGTILKRNLRGEAIGAAIAEALGK